MCDLVENHVRKSTLATANLYKTVMKTSITFKVINKNAVMLNGLLLLKLNDKCKASYKSSVIGQFLSLANVTRPHTKHWDWDNGIHYKCVSLSVYTYDKFYFLRKMIIIDTKDAGFIKRKYVWWIIMVQRWFLTELCRFCVHSQWNFLILFDMVYMSFLHVCVCFND